METVHNQGSRSNISSISNNIVKSSTTALPHHQASTFRLSHERLQNADITSNILHDHGSISTSTLGYQHIKPINTPTPHFTTLVSLNDQITQMRGSSEEQLHLSRHSHTDNDRLRRIINDQEARIAELSKENDQLRLKHTMHEARSSVELENKVTVLSLEIERLRGLAAERLKEVEIYKEQLNQTEKKNLLVISDFKRSLEQQLRASIEIELKSKCSLYEEKIALLTIDIQKWQSLASERQNEIEHWRLKVSSAEHANLKQLDDVKKRWENEMKIQLESEIKMKLSSYENKMNLITIENERLRKENENCSRKIQDLQHQHLIELEEHKRRWEASFKGTIEKEYSIKINEHERKNSAMQIRLAECEQEIEIWRSRVRDSEKSIQLRLEEYKNEWEISIRSRLESEVSIKSKEYEEKYRHILIERDHWHQEAELWKKKFGEEEKRYHIQIEDLKKSLEISFRSKVEAEIRLKFHEFESKIENLNFEIEKYKLIIAEKEKEIQLITIRYTEIEKSHSSHLEEVRIQIENTLKSRFEVEIRSKYEEFEKKILVFSQENNSLRQEAMHFKNKLIEAENNYRISLEENIKSSQLKLRSSIETEIASKTHKYEITIHEYESQINRFKLMIKEKDHEIENMKVQFFELEKHVKHQNEESRKQWELSVRASIEREVRMSEEAHKHQLIVFKTEKEQLSHRISILESSLVEKQREVELLMIKYRDCEASISQRINESRVSWETNLRVKFEGELQAKIHDLNVRISSIEIEKQHFAKELENKEYFIREKTKEIEIWMKKYSELEKSIPSKIVHHRQEYEAELRIKFENETKSFIKDFENQILRLKSESSRLEKIIFDKEKEIEHLHLSLRDKDSLRIKMIEEALMRQEHELRARLEVELKKQITEYQTKITHLSREVEEYKILLVEREKDIQHFKSRIHALEIEHSRKIDELKIHLESHYKTKFETEINIGVRNQIDKIRYELESRIEQLLSDNEELTKNLESKHHEIESLHYRLTNLQREKESQYHIIEERYEEKIRLLISERDGYLSMISELRGQIDEISYRFEEYKRLHSGIDHEAKWRAERSALEAQVIQFKQLSQELEQSYKVVFNENKFLSKSASEKQREIDRLRADFNNIEFRYSRESSDMRAQLELSSRSQLDIHELNAKHSNEISYLQSQLSKHVITIENTKSELAKVYDLLEKRKIEDEKNLKTIEFLRFELKKYQENTHSRLSIHSDSLNERIIELEARLQEAERDKENFRKLYEKNSLQLTEKNRELVLKIKEIDALRIKYESNLRDFGNRATSEVHQKKICL